MRSFRANYPELEAFCRLPPRFAVDFRGLAFFTTLRLLVPARLFAPLEVRLVEARFRVPADLAAPARLPVPVLRLLALVRPFVVRPFVPLERAFVAPVLPPVRTLAGVFFAPERPLAECPAAADLRAPVVVFRREVVLRDVLPRLLPPLRPPFLAGSLFVALPLPEPLFLPPPLILLTVAQALLSASSCETPCSL